MPNSNISNETSTYENNTTSMSEELRKKNMLLRRIDDENKILLEDVQKFRTLYDRECRKYNQYTRDMETEINARDKELKKKENDLFLLDENTQRLILQIEKLKDELSCEKQTSQTLAEDLAKYRRQLQEERDRTLPMPSANETALFEAETKVNELKNVIDVLRNDQNRMFDENCNLAEQIQEVKDQLANKAMEVDSLRSLVQCQQDDLNNQKQHIQDLQIELHQTKTENASTDIAKQGNSLFAEVVDGKEKLERQLSLLYQTNIKLKNELSRAMKLAYENAFNRASVVNGRALTGPTLDHFKILKGELEQLLMEKMDLVKRVHALEDGARRNFRQWARECPLEFGIFQESVNAMNTSAKQRAEGRILQLELREHDLLTALCYEKQRAAAVPQLEQRNDELQRMVANYQRTQLSLNLDMKEEEFKEDGESTTM